MTTPKIMISRLRFLRLLPFHGAWFFLTCVTSLYAVEPGDVPRLDREPYVNPWILADFYGWISDRGSIVLSVDLMNAQRSNRYWGEWEQVEDQSGGAWVKAHKRDEWVRYRLLGETKEGLHVVHVLTGGGGSGSFGNMLLLEYVREDQYKIEDKKGQLVPEERLILRCRGQFVPTKDWLEEMERRQEETE